MALFLTTRGISSQLEDIFIEANSLLYIVTPYLQFSKTLYERLSECTKRGVPTTIVCRERDKISQTDERMLLELDCNIYFKSDLHAKCYLNENVALIASMNLYNYSEANNREMGVSLSKKDDNVAYDKCFKEVTSIINTSVQFRAISKSVATVQTDFNANYLEFLQEWHKALVVQYPSTKFGKDENRLHAKDFPFPGMEFSNSYGFATISFDKNDSLQRQRDRQTEQLRMALPEYRIYWHSANRICIYHAKSVLFDSLTDDIKYCSLGLAKLTQTIASIMLQ